MSDPGPSITPEEAAETGTLAARISLRQRSGGVIVPVLTAVIAFLIGGAVVAAREISRDPKVLIAAQPTRGLDVGAIEYLHRRLVEERDKGRGVLLVSLELEEIFSLSDRILVIYEGEIAGEHTGEVSEDEIGLEMLGGKQAAAA